MSERRERTDEQLAQYLRLNPWLFWTVVKGGGGKGRGKGEATEGREKGEATEGRGKGQASEGRDQFSPVRI